MKELKLLSIDNTELKTVALPKQLTEQIRSDLIKRAVESLQSIKRQKYGADPRAGKKASANLSRRRHDYRGSYGHGISRVPRKILTRRGTRMYWVGAVAPGTVGGRRAHPPKAEKNWKKDLNKKERKKAIRSALSATFNIPLTKERGHNPPNSYPFIIESKIEAVDKTKGILPILKKLGFGKELTRTKQKKIRAGKGKMRGRKYKRKTGLLLITSKECPLNKAARNIPGIDIIPIKHINAEILAPGGVPGRLTLFTDKSLELIEKEKLFI